MLSTEKVNFLDCVTDFYHLYSAIRQDFPSQERLQIPKADI